MKVPCYSYVVFINRTVKKLWIGTNMKWKMKSIIQFIVNFDSSWRNSSFEILLIKFKGIWKISLHFYRFIYKEMAHIFSDTCFFMLPLLSAGKVNLDSFGDTVFKVYTLTGKRCETFSHVTIQAPNNITTLLQFTLSPALLLSLKLSL